MHDESTPLSRRRWLALAGGGAIAPAFVRHARAADVPRFALGVASGQPRERSIVLWTRVTGSDLPAQVVVRWELARDEAFTEIAARGVETAVADDAHSVHAEPGSLEPGRRYWYRFEALGARSVAGRTRTAPAADTAVGVHFALASCQRYDHGHYAAWRHVAASELDFVLFVGDYIYEYVSPPTAVRRHDGLLQVRTLEQYRARYAQYKSDPLLQAAHAAAPWLVVWDDHEVDNDYANLLGQNLQAGFREQRAAAYRAYWEHMPFPKALRPNGASMRIYGRTDWGALACIHTIDDRQYRDPQACPKPGRGGSNVVSVSACPELLDPRRTLLGDPQERWLARSWDPNRRWNLLAQQTLMARFTLPGGDPPGYWTDGWDGYAPARQRLLQTVVDRRVGGVVVLGGDVHAHYVADLKVDFDDARSPVVATELCGTSISSRGGAQDRAAAALRHNPHLRYARSDQRGYVACRLDADTLHASLMVVDKPEDPNSAVGVAARFVIDALQPGALLA